MNLQGKKQWKQRATGGNKEQREAKKHRRKWIQKRSLELSFGDSKVRG